MITKKINLSILIASNILRIVSVLSLAIVLSSFFWWILGPLVPTSYVAAEHINPKEDNVKFIINRYPFGEVIAPKQESQAAPAITSKIHVNGIYFNNGDSMAFVDFDNKGSVVKVGQSITANVVVAKINVNSIEVTANGTQTTIDLSGVGSAKPVNPPMASPHSQVLSPNSVRQHTLPSRSPVNNNSASDNSHKFADERAKLLEKFAKMRQEQKN